jgi:sulfite exporter TauE/SafE
MIHVLMGPDHLAAIAPMAVEDRSRSWRLGFRWGIGHSAGVLIVGVGVLMVRELIPVDLISSFSERLVGLVLIAIGLWALRRAFDRRLHTHVHTHESRRHEHFHLHGAPEQHALPRAHAHTHAALAVGTLHGLAGSSHLLGILPALALPSTTLAVAYIGAFGVGTIAGMMAFSSLIGWIAQRFSLGSANVYRGMMTACALVAIATGGVWLAG